MQGLVTEPAESDLAKLPIETVMNIIGSVNDPRDSQNFRSVSHRFNDILIPTVFGEAYGQPI